MKSAHHRLGAGFILGGTALVFLFLDLHGIRGDWSALPAVVGQVVALTIIVGPWIYAQIYLEDEREEAPEVEGKPGQRALFVEPDLEAVIQHGHGRPGARSSPSRKTAP